MALIFLLYWLLIPYPVYALIDALGAELLGAFARWSILFTLRFLPPVLLYLLFVKRPAARVLSMAPLRLKTVLHIAFITVFVRQIEFLLEFGLPLVLGLDLPPMLQMSLPWTHWAAGLVIAVLCKEFLFRGVLYSEYQNQGVSIGKTALVTGLFFGLVHTGIVGIAASAILGILWAYLLYYTRSIWAPLLSHAIYNVLWQLHPFLLRNVADLEAFLPTYLLIVGIATLGAAPVMIVFAKAFWAENRRETKGPAEESRAFTWSYWVLIAVMLTVIAAASLVCADGIAPPDFLCHIPTL